MILLLLACQKQAPPQVFVAPPAPRFQPDTPVIEQGPASCDEVSRLTPGDTATCSGILYGEHEALRLEHRSVQYDLMTDAYGVCWDGRLSDRAIAQATSDARWRDGESLRQREQLRQMSRPVEWVLVAGAVLLTGWVWGQVGD